MKNHLKAVATCVLMTAMATAHGQATQPGGTAAGKKTVRHKTTRKPARPSVETQIQQLRQDMESQINQLKQQLTDSNSQLQAAQQQAAAANAAAAQAQQTAQQQAQQTAETSTAVNSLQGAVTDLKANSTSLASTIQDTQANILKKVDNPDAIHFKGITLAPTGSFIAAETTWRSKGVGADVNTPFSALPLNHQENANLSEFFGSGRQSRIALLAEGKLPSATLRGYYEADFLSAGVTSNNNQSNSYTLRQRQVWAQAALNNGITFTGGQQWSLITETKKGLDNRTEALPQTIDAQYTVGFNWERQYGFRVTKNFHDKFWVGVSAENPQTLNVGGRGLPNNYIIGQAGTGGGLYNPTANYAYNLAPDMIAKIAAEPGWGHYEVWGVARFFRNRIYPNVVTTTVNGVATTSGNSNGAYNDSTVGGAVGGSLRVPTLHKHLDLGIKGAWGDGANRYNNTGLADLTIRPNGQVALIHGYSGLGTFEVHATPRLDVYANYGIDGVLRRVFINPTTRAQTGYGAYTNNQAGCSTESIPAAGGNGFVPAGLPSTCAVDNRDLQELSVGYWYDFYKGPKGRFRQGVQYSYTERQVFSGAGAPAPSGEDNMFFTSIRYYLP